ncbi:MAG: o-succinylbenzoate--CoA ligase [Bacteroidetes bacterium]|nr:o-succinylbenzoate--CoA ligase [Bacteroidota bacterium]
MSKQFDWTAKWKHYQPDKTAFEEFESGRSLSWKQLDQLGNFLAHQLNTEYGLKKGDRIAILSENRLELISLFVVAQKAGIILVPLNYRLTAPEIDFLLSESKPSAIWYEQQFESRLKNTGQFETIGIRETMEALESLSNEALKNKEVPSYENADFDENHPVFLIFTSGTTSFPKGSVYTHKMLFWNSINTEMRLDITSQDRSINCAPSFHTGSWNVLQTPFMHHGAYTLLMRKFEPEKVLSALEDYNMTIFWAVPTMLKMMAEEASFEKSNLRKLRYFVVGGEAMPIPLIEKWHSKNIPIRQGYGLTEVGPNVTSLNQEDAIRKQGSIGKPNFYYEIRIADENGNAVEQGMDGELLLKGPNVTPGYWNNPEATKNTIKNGWFHTGDLVRQDEEGYIYVIDRLKNMYISGGENVYPAEVEFVLRQHAAIEEVAIIGVPDEKWGESGMAFVVKRKEKQTDSEKLTVFCQQRLAKYKIPKHFRFVESLPKNDAGKIDRKSLIKSLN